MNRFLPLLALIVTGCFEESKPVDVDTIVVSTHPGTTIYDSKTVVRLPDGKTMTVTGLVGSPGDLFILTVEGQELR